MVNDDERVPGRDVGHVVVRVAVTDAQCDRYSPVGTDGQDVDELAQCGAEVLVVPIGDDRGLLPAAPPGLVGATGERHARRVIVQFGTVDPKGTHRCEHGLGQKARPVSIEEPVEGASDPVVVEMLRVT
ncbi:MAG: hypothetical protein ACRDZR_16380 [Acidimicrobiales bacterium]